MWKSVDQALVNIRSVRTSPVDAAMKSRDHTAPVVGAWLLNPNLPKTSKSPLPLSLLRIQNIRSLRHWSG